MAKTKSASPSLAVQHESTTESDSRLVEQCRRGDHNAFRKLVLRYEKRLWRVIYRFVRDSDLAEDLSQETFLRVFERLDQFDPSRRFGPWLFRIGVNLTLDHLRKRKRRGWTALFSESPEETQVDPPVTDPRLGTGCEAGGSSRSGRDSREISHRFGITRLGELFNIRNRGDFEPQGSNHPLATVRGPTSVPETLEQTAGYESTKYRE